MSTNFDPMILSGLMVELVERGLPALREEDLEHFTDCQVLAEQALAGLAVHAEALADTIISEGGNRPTGPVAGPIDLATLLQLHTYVARQAREHLLIASLAHKQLATLRKKKAGGAKA